jgi:transmembrane sensor
MSRTDYKNLVPLVTESRLARQYAAIRERVPAARRRRLWEGAAGWAVAAAATTALAVVFVRSERLRTATLDDAAIIESAPAVDGHPGPTTSVTLADGSRVDLGAATRARLTSAKAKAIRIDLERGSVDIEATHVEGRTFVVGAGPYDVRVVGTHFVVRRDPGAQVTVQVERGAVEVAAAAGTSGETRRLAAGEQWSAPESNALPTATALAAPSPVANAAPAAAVGASPLPNAPVTQATPVAPIAAPAVGVRRDESARDLFDEAQRARADGRPLDAARAFDRLRHTFPHDPRAALSAFELGRLRLDALGDPRGAEEAFRDAIALGPSSPFREDAEARHVEALRRSGDGPGCLSARAAYLARWPNGTYRRAVEVGCGD